MVMVSEEWMEQVTEQAEMAKLIVLIKEKTYLVLLLLGNWSYTLCLKQKKK